ncbi:MAG: transcriptional regulator [Acidobacteria bacterium]|nr:transcriptional regulator [Acidobacteriota bacterium]
MLRRACREAGNQSAWAMQHGLTPQYVSDVLNVRRPITDNILHALGLKRVTRYVPR